MIARVQTDAMVPWTAVSTLLSLISRVWQAVK